MAVELFEVRYTMPGHPTVVASNMTRAGADDICRAVLTNGGVGACRPMSVAKEMAAQDRALRAWINEEKAKHYARWQRR